MLEPNRDDLITAFIPSAPSPVSGFLIMLPASEVRELNMSVDEALKVIISLGMVMPSNTAASLLAARERKLKK